MARSFKQRHPVANSIIEAIWGCRSNRWPSPDTIQTMSQNECIGGWTDEDRIILQRYLKMFGRVLPDMLTGNRMRYLDTLNL